MDFIDIRTALIMLHLFGVALGAGGAYLSDMMFFSSVKDKVISGTELRFLTIGSRAVWIGLAFLVVSGTGLFLTDIEGYMASSKFLAKMSIVGIIILNGIIFHMSHLPRMKRHTGQHFPSSDEFVRHRPLLAASGAVSLVSWTSALILGGLKMVPYSYGAIMAVYATGVVLAAVVAVIVIRRII